ncbi:nuclease domain-containing protein [Lactobacillus sp. Sy-1]|uniref:nuclease domain-containing protein n=1 Tax=Lactobacillus sp. Sy-1 TaxID=2109645 RepID=UPI001C5AB0CB|nr:nuclease domain-containing protein [Lactobacillus sp. Sy-1]MBW1606072.1 hypothetical protein [Lactobacillus sp. Sy-1]
MDLQDKIYINSKKYGKMDFVFSNKELDSVPLELPENTISELVFKNLENYRIYLDGLDLISNNRKNSSRIKKDDNNNLYINPSDVPYELYDNNNNDFKYLPGMYLLKLVNEDTMDVFYSVLKITPKHLTSDGLDKLKIDLEKTVRGLSRSFISNNNGMKSNYSSELTYNDIKAIELLCDQQNNFSNFCFDLINSPRFAISNYYQWTNKLNGFIDRKSKKEMSTRQNNRYKYYGKGRKINYNTVDNISLKREFKYIYTVVERLLQISDYSTINNDQINVKNVLSSYISIINSIYNKDWFKDVADKNTNMFSSTSNSNLDSRYSFIHSIYWKLEHLSYFSDKFERQYNYYWKRTDLLYEIWGYVKVIEALVDLGFKPKSGWIFDDVSADYKGLNEDTEVIMDGKTKDNHNFYLKVIYDHKISAKQSKDANPMFHRGTHNRPDVTIEIYDSDNVFFNAIILDTKYRDIKYVWNGKHSSGPQIIAYKDSIFSPFPYCDEKYKKMSKLFRDLNVDKKSAVLGVAIIHPGKIDDLKDNVELNEKYTDVYNIKANPSNNGFNSLKSFLNKYIDSAESTINQFYGYI